MAINPIDFSGRAEFGHYETKVNPKNGNKKDEFVPDYKVWFGWRNMTVNQQFTLLGINKTESKLIVIRHNNKVNQKKYVRVDGVEYNVIYKSIDNHNARDTFDLIAISEIEKP